MILAGPKPMPYPMSAPPTHRPQADVPENRPTLLRGVLASTRWLVPQNTRQTPVGVLLAGQAVTSHGVSLDRYPLPVLLDGLAYPLIGLSPKTSVGGLLVDLPAPRMMSRLNRRCPPDLRWSRLSACRR